MECLKDKIIMYRANEVAYGVICWLKRSKICDFLIIFQALEPRYDPISDARRHMNDYFNFRSDRVNGQVVKRTVHYDTNQM